MKKIILPGILLGIIILLLGIGESYLFSFIFPSINAEFNNNLFRSWSDPVKSLYFIYPFVVGLIFAWTWNKIKGLIKGSTFKKGFNFGLTIWLISSVPAVMVIYLSFQLSSLMILTWIIDGFLTSIISGLILAKINK